MSTTRATPLDHNATAAADASPSVLYLLDYTGLGGGETSFLAFIEAWRRAVPEVRPVVVLPASGPVAERLAALEIATRILPYPRFLRRGPLPWFSLPAALRLGRLMDEIRPSLVHANNFFGMLYAGLPARRRRIPLVWTCHAWFDIDTTAKVFAARYLAARVTCVSEAVRRRTARRLGRRPPTVTDYLGIVPFESGGETKEAIRSGVRAEFGVAEREPLLAVVGRFQAIKGHEVLLDALPALRDRLPHLRVWFIGDAQPGNAEEQAHKQKIEARVGEMGLGGRVRFLGFRADARRLIRALDALVIPSHRESFSMAAVEGLEAGIPVVGPNGWGPKEIIQAPETGLRFRRGDAASLAEQILAVLLREGEGAKFDPHAGPRRVRQMFTVDAHLQRTLKLYRELVPW